MLGQSQIDQFHKDGYLLVEQAVSGEKLAALRQVTYDLIEKSRDVDTSNDVYDLDHGHSASTPRLTRIKQPTLRHPIYWEVIRSAAMTGVLRDLLGFSVALRTSKLNTKAPGGGAAVEWHQDWAFYPHTHDGLLALGLMLEDVDQENGPLMVVPGTHRGPVLDHHRNGVFAGAIDPDDPAFDLDKAVTLTGKAGDMTVHHVRTLHGSAPNRSTRSRMILFYECVAGDAWPLVGPDNASAKLHEPDFWTALQSRLICGEASLQPRVEQVPVRIPLPPAPDATSIFKTQASAGAKSAFAAG